MSASPEEDPAPLEAPPLDLRALGVRAGLGLLVFFALSFLVTLAFGDAIEAAGGWFVERYGGFGVGVAVTLVDTSPIPMVSEPVYLLALSGGLEPPAIFVASALGSLLAAALGYGLGWVAGRPVLVRLVSAERREQARQLISGYGFYAIALAALTPLPFALCTWTAGALRMRLAPFALGCLFRVPKVAFYLWLVHRAWSAAR